MQCETCCSVIRFLSLTQSRSGVLQEMWRQHQKYFHCIWIQRKVVPYRYRKDFFCISLSSVTDGWMCKGVIWVSRVREGQSFFINRKKCTGSLSYRSCITDHPSSITGTQFFQFDFSLSLDLINLCVHICNSYHRLKFCPCWGITTSYFWSATVNADLTVESWVLRQNSGKTDVCDRLININKWEMRSWLLPLNCNLCTCQYIIFFFRNVIFNIFIVTSQ